MKNSKKIIIIVIPFVLLIIVGVVYKLKNDDIYVSETFVGESEHWKVSYQINGYVNFYKEDGKLDLTSEGYKKILVKYIGDLEEISQLSNLKVKTLNGESGINFEKPPKSHTFKFHSDVGPNTLIEISKGESMNIEVIWEGKVERKETINLE